MLANLQGGMVPLTLVFAVHGASHDFAAAGLAAGCYAVGSGAAGPIRGRVLDRTDHFRVLLWASAAQVAGLIALAAAGGEVASTIALALLVGLANPPFAASLRVLLLDRFGEKEEVDAAYSLASVAQEVNALAGPLLAAALVSAASPSFAFCASAGFVVIGSCIYLRTLSRSGPLHDPASRAAGPVAGPLRFPAMRWLIVATCLIGVGAGALVVAIPAYATDRHATAGAGVLLAMLSLGSIVGGILYGRAARSERIERRAVLLLGLLSIGMAGVALVPPPVPMAIALFVAGSAYSPFVATSLRWVDRIARGQHAAESYSWLSTALAGGLALGSAAAGFASDAAGLPAALALPVVAALLAAVAALAASVPPGSLLGAKPTAPR
jgi:MFS family permease